MAGMIFQRATLLSRPVLSAPKLVNDDGVITAEARPTSPPALVNTDGAVTAEARP
jgi:hypothetical protein